MANTSLIMKHFAQEKVDTDIYGSLAPGRIVRQHTCRAQMAPLGKTIAK